MSHERNEENDRVDMDDFTVFEPWFTYEEENDHFKLLLAFGKSEGTGFEIGLSRRSVRRLKDVCEVVLKIPPPGEDGEDDEDEEDDI